MLLRTALIFSLFLASSVSAQSKLFEVFGTAADEKLGDALVCRSSGIHVSSIRTDDFSFTDTGIVNVYDQNGTSLYQIHFPFTPIGGELFGYAMLPMPDTDNDSNDEIIITAPFDIGAPGTGAVYIFNEGSANSTFPTSSFISGQANDHFGRSIALIDYPPLDGKPEIVIGAPNRIHSVGIVGSIIFADVIDGSQFATINALSGIDQFGESISRVKDLDNNGSDDIAVGAPDSYTRAGAVRIYSITGDINTPAHSLLREIQGSTPSERFGTKVESVGDVTGDGIDDLLVAAAPINNTAGLVRLYSGSDIISAAPNISPICTINGTVSGEQLGSGLARLDDADANGLAEFAVSAPGANANRGRVSIFEFNGPNNCVEVRTLIGSNATDQFGRMLGTALCPALTAQKDALVVGTFSNQTASLAGSAIIFDAPPTATPSPTPTATPTATPTPIPPISARLDFRISEKGEFRINIRYNREPDDNCSSDLFGRIQVGNEILPVELLQSVKYSTANQNETEQTIRILNFPTAAKVDGKIPVFNMLLRTTCGSNTFNTKVFARYMNCGVPGVEVSLTTWIDTLIKALNTAQTSLSIRSDKNVKLVRLKKRKRKK